jgi:hypothetical protein
VCGLYDVNPAKFGATNNVITQASHFGNQTEVFNGVDLSVNARLGRAFVIGGVSTGRSVTDNCYTNSRPDLLSSDSAGNFTTATAQQPRTAAFCHVAPPFSPGTQIKMLGAYPLPWGLQASATFQNLGGLADTALNTFTNAQIVPSLGRNLAAGSSGSATFAILAPQTVFETRLTQVDARFAKTLKMSRARVHGTLDVYNLFNANTILAINSTYGASWLKPGTVLGPRLVKFGAIIEF